MNDMVATETKGKELMDVEVARAVAQIQGSMAIAKKFPRDENAAIERIKQAAGRRVLAESAEYDFSRGGSKVSGPSIRAAEAVAQAWGNLSTGVTEIRRDEGESQAMAYAVDLESNYWKSIVFTVPHIRDTKGGGKALTETRDIYELVMNMGSRRLRNCIIAVIPGDVMDLFTDECNKTLSKDAKPLSDRIPIMLAMLEKVGVTKPMVEQKYCCKAEALTDRQVAQLRRIFLAIQDGIASVEDHFQSAGPKRAAGTIPKADDKTTTPKIETKQGADPSSFANFGTEKPKGRDRAVILQDIFGFADQLGLKDDDLEKKCIEAFKVPSNQTTPEQLEQIREFLQAQFEAKKGIYK